MNISLLQTDIVWEKPEQNRALLEAKINALEGQQHVIVLPETFSTGFSMHNAAELAESMNGTTIQWMKALAQQKRSIITGSIIISEDNKYYNRMLWVLPNGEAAHYDKRHLFSYAGEGVHFEAGAKRVIAQVNGWKVCLQICYDLRFPVWARNTDDYDMLLYIANWPQQRNEAWETLLRARAIENMSYVVGVNRVGSDGNGHHYMGNSSIYSPLGALMNQKSQEETTITHSFQHTLIEECRTKFPFLKDRDDFLLR
ncbi:MAG: amidohydrolase [Phycisphaerales bacterium]|nr:amidohydrolase [Phycisphaerales bacterium]